MSTFFLFLFISFSSLVRSAEIGNARVIITGGANGIGRACVHDLLRGGAQMVAILDMDVVNGTKVAERFSKQFGKDRVLFFPTDVADPLRFEADFVMAVQCLGGLDIMINDAGILNETIWRRMIDTDIDGVIQGTLMSFDVMGKHKGGKGGTVVNLASIAALMLYKHFPVYVGAKESVLGFSTSVALSYNVTGIAVKTICPGATNTRLETSKDHRFLDFVNYEEAIQLLASLVLQEPGRVSQAIMRLIREAPNGAVWVVEPEQPIISLNIPNYREWGTPV